MGDPRPAGAHSAGYQEEQQGYPSESVDYGGSGQGYPSESTQYGRGASGQGYAPEPTGRAEGRRAGARAYPEERGYDERGQAGVPGRRPGGAALTILTGLLMAFVGIVGIVRSTFFVNVANYPFYYTVRGRGITEIAVGAVLLAVGVCLLLGMHWAHNVAIGVLVIAAIVSFLTIPFYPFWSILLLALSVVAIWELGHHRSSREWA